MRLVFTSSTQPYITPRQPTKPSERTMTVDIAAQKQSQLEELAKLIEQNNPAPELKSQAKQLVFGNGNAAAKVVFIGEAPGKKEDETGVPFVGASGKFLDEMLENIGLNRKDIYITNIVKYRPPKNRDPEESEKSAFWPYLLQEIAIIRPTIIATLGRHSGQAFLSNLRISQDHGQPKRIKLMLDGKEESVLILPLYHPAAALYNRSLRETLIEDFQSMSEII